MKNLYILYIMSICIGFSIHAMDTRHAQTPYVPSNPRIVRDLSKIQNRVKTYILRKSEELARFFGTDEAIRTIRTNNEIPIIKITLGPQTMYFYMAPSDIAWAFAELIDESDLPAAVKAELAIWPRDKNAVSLLSAPHLLENYYIAIDNGRMYIFKRLISKRNPSDR